MNVSPGVYTKIIDLSSYVQAIPSTIGFICGLTKRGRDNELVFIGSRSEFISEFGEPNISDYGKNYGQGPYLAYNFLGESGALYWIRPLPDDATYANLRLDATLDATAAISISYVDNVNIKDELKTNLAVDGTNNPIAILYPIGRGDYYNALGIRLSEHSNPTLSGVYVLDIYEKQSDGDEVIIESFDISFDANAVDRSGESIFIKTILERYSSVLRAELEETDGSYSPGYDLVARVYDKNIGSVTVDVSGSTIRDNKQDFSDWETNPETGNASYVVIAKDARGNTIWGWLGVADDSEDNEVVNVFQERDLSSSPQGWNGATSTFDIDSDVTYEIKKCYVSITSAFTTSNPVPLKKGSEGSLRDTSGNLDTAIATQILAQAYQGIINDNILDIENVYFTLVFDAGYPDDVKTAISTLVQTRRDCVGILDNSDNATVSTALDTRTNIHTFNTMYLALYEPYHKIYDAFTGQDVWFSPVYSMSYLLPRNDNIAELWYAVAGFNRGVPEGIKELRFNSRLGQRDQMYLKQLNPIVKFSNGYAVWGQLTSQAKSSALQSLNIVRLVLYVKRALEQFCKYFIFEQNDETTWGQIASSITDFLEILKSKRGLYSYSTEVGATDYEKKTKTCHVNVVLEPVRALEKIELNFYIK